MCIFLLSRDLLILSPSPSPLSAQGKDPGSCAHTGCLLWTAGLLGVHGRFLFIVCVFAPASAIVGTALKANWE